jgi:hypothetical protein
MGAPNPTRLSTALPKLRVTCQFRLVRTFRSMIFSLQASNGAISLAGNDALILVLFERLNDLTARLEVFEADSAGLIAMTVI